MRRTNHLRVVEGLRPGLPSRLALISLAVAIAGPVGVARADGYDFKQAANLLFTGSPYSPSREVGFINGTPLIVTVDSADAATCVVTVRTNAPGITVYRMYFLNNVAPKAMHVDARQDSLTTTLTGQGVVMESYSDPASGNVTKFNPAKATTAKIETPVPLPRETIEEAWALIFPHYCKGA